MADVVFAMSTCTLVDPASGLKVRLSEGEAWWASDPFVKARPDLFVSAPANVRGQRAVKSTPATKIVLPEVEQAVSVPGVKRQVKRATEK